jgi:uncharacterized protein YqcC (DUF446 family)
MSAQIERETDVYRIEWDDEIPAVVHTWKEFVNGQAFRDGCAEILDVIEKRSARKMLVDTSGIQVHDDEDEEWLQDEWIPRTMEAGIEASATVPQDSVIAKMDLEKFMNEVEEYDYKSTMVESVSEAREWLSNK